MKPLDALSFPLTGASLIEASAGTGKTYTIVNLYLRLLLGHQCQPLGVEQILVVTFTNAATAELKERIRQKLRQSYLDFFAGHSADVFVQSLIEQLPEHDIACQRLALATKQMDEAAVFTIHGFSQRMLTQHAFESGAMYEQSLILDESEWLKLAVEDYWRKYIVGLPPVVLSMLLKVWPSPAALLGEIRNLLYRHAEPHSSGTIEACIAKIEQYAEQVEQTKRWWIEKEIAEQLSKGNLNGRSRLAKVDVLLNMQSFCQSALIEPEFDKDGWALFSAEKLQKALKKGSADLSHLDFSRFDELVDRQQACKASLRLAFCAQSLQKVGANLASNKRRLQLLAPDDLLTTLQRALQVENAGDGVESTAQSQTLARRIQQTYPAVLIDEFQDTDPVQFEVFRSIYGHSYLAHPLCWIMIGDPKQAIYAFRGADIFTYIQAKDWVPQEQQFTLSTNWRSQPRLVEAINALFEQSEQGFLFEKSIPFHPVLAAKQQVGLSIEGQNLPALQFQHLRASDAKPLAWTQTQYQLASHTAGQISHLLSKAQQGQASINGQALQAGDCCVLVRDRGEADLIKQALGRLNVASVFLVRKSVFDTQVAQDLFMLLKALSSPSDERMLKAALLSELFAMTALQVDELFNNELAWQRLIEHCYQWQRDWQQHGLMLVVNRVSAHFELEHKLVSHHSDGLRRLTDLRHLTELLQQQSVLLQGEAQLLHWYQEKLLEPDHNHEGQQLRLETDANLVQIITQHASKGLEFPLVFVPFACRFKATKDALYHDQQQRLKVDFLAAPEHMLEAERERLAEDIRLLYVALTRAVYFCSVGIWNNAHGKSKSESGLFATALGCLLFKRDESPNDGLIQSRVESLAETLDIGYQSFEYAEKGTVLDSIHLSAEQQKWQSAQLDRLVKRQWRLTSYSAISSQQQHLEVIMPGMDEGHDLANVDEQDNQREILSAFTFERGAKAGSFLHGVLENIDFQQPSQLAEAIEQQGKWYGIDDRWYATLQSWLSDVLQARFSKAEQGSKAEADLCLAALNSTQLKVEMEFHMPLQEVKVEAFNQLINSYNQQHGRQYHFEQLNGMIKGYIDLMFEFNGKFYVADYKSNHLGNDLDCYHIAALEHAMSEHDYHLQAILYTLALHRWLRQKLPDYQYEKHVGGAYYLFLRGMSEQRPVSGVYHILPDKHLILALDALFAGISMDQAPMESIATKPDKDSQQPDTSAQQQQGQLDLW
jgi:exodeoxyribonuclease V beta subunit